MMQKMKVKPMLYRKKAAFTRDDDQCIIVEADDTEWQITWEGENHITHANVTDSSVEMNFNAALDYAKYYGWTGMEVLSAHMSSDIETNEQKK